jgi:RecA-family ATPase
MLLQHLAVCVSSGKKLFGKFDVARGPVLHMDEEQTETQTARRYIRIAAGMDVKELDIQRVVLENRLDSPEILETVQEDLIKLFGGKKLILIDSLKKISEAEENSPQIEKIMKILKRVAEKANTTIVLVHHMGKSSGGD